MNIYAYGMRFDDDSNAITVIDEENQTAATTGYINGEPVDFSGGGGSSDFSTTEVTVINSTGTEYIGVINPIDEADLHALGTDFEIIPGTNVFQCVLYKGLGWVDMGTFSQHGRTITVSGNATYDGEELVHVTGDCTITIS